MQPVESIAVRFLGFGEAASLFAAGLARAGLNDLAAYDIAVHGGPGEALLRERAATTGTALMSDRAGFCDASWVFAMVQPGVAEQAARETAPYLRPGAFYVDFSSASPKRKQAAAASVTAHGGRYVDAGIIGSVPASGHRVPIFASGPDAATFRDVFAPYGMDITVAGDVVGAAAGIKLVRSVLAKGLEALYVEALVAARRSGVGDEVLDSFCAFLDARPAHATAALLLQSHVVHAARRAEEAAMSRDLVIEAGLDPVMTDAVIEIMRRTAATGAAGSADGRQPATMDDALAILDEVLPRRAPENDMNAKEDRSQS